jgi:HSP20 family protein
MSTSLPRRRSESYSPAPLSTEDFFRMSPFQLMRHFTEEMDRMWSGRFGREGSGGEMTDWRPAVDVREHDGKLQVHAELPGVNENDVKVSIENDMLIIQGERKREEEREDEGWYRAERSYGSFCRTIPLPEGAESDKANARFNNGVLEIEMPIPKTQHQAKQIPISGASQRSQSGSPSAGQQTGQAPSTSGHSSTSGQSVTSGQPSTEKTGKAGSS